MPGVSDGKLRFKFTIQMIALVSLILAAARPQFGSKLQTVKKEGIEVKNQAETLVYETDKNLKELGDKLSAEEIAKITAAKDELQTALNAGTAINSQSTPTNNDTLVP